jgi:hypothetical protein
MTLHSSLRSAPVVWIALHKEHETTMTNKKTTAVFTDGGHPMSKPKRRVKTHLDRRGMLIFELLEEGSRPRTVRRFAYGMKHQVWLRMDIADTKHTLLSAEPAAMVKEQIARWST